MSSWERSVSCTWVIVLAAALGIDAGNTATAESAWSAGDLVRAERIGALELSPDATTVVWVKSTVEEVDGEPRRVSNLWRVGVDGGEAAPLTRGRDTVRAPRLSPDGRHVAFLSDRTLPGAGDGKAKGKLAKTQLWVLPLAGGEAFPATRSARDVRAYDWAGPETLVYAAQEAPSLWELERREATDAAVVVDDAEHEPPIRLFRVGIDGKPAERLTRNTDWIDALAVSPDGRRAVVTAQQSLSYEFDQRVPPHTFLVDLATGERTRLLADAGQLPFAVEWAPDGSGFWFLDEHTRHPRYRMATITKLYWHALDAASAQPAELDWPRGLGRGYVPVESGVLALLVDGVHSPVARVERDGGSGFARRNLRGTHARHVETLAASRDGRRVVYVHSTATRPPQLYSARVDGDALVGVRRLTELNAGWADKPTGRVEVVRWVGALDEEVEGLLHYPLDWREGERRPLVLDIHGGPAGVDRDLWTQSWSGPNLLWRQRGAFVFQPNYHGSSGYGLDWVESIGEGRYYELELPDIERGVDALVARGLADPERLAATGWSNGGILTAALIVHTRRYRAAVVGAADVEWVSDWGNVDFGAAFDNYYLGGAPWEVPEVYFDKSPFFRLTEVTTPTLVHTGTEDRNVPPHQSWSLFRALQQIGKAPARLVLYPGEPHGLREVAHQRRKIDEDAAWLERYLFASEEPRNPSVKEGSRLAGLLARRHAARVRAALGVDRDGVLVPETVPFAGLEVGRFEVTRAQLAAFDPRVAAEAGRADLPATGIDFARAQAYVRWLAAITGRAFRLPTVAEAERLAEAADGAGNTLEHWAGYAPNPDDRARLLEAIRGLGPGALLLPVGSFAGTGDAPVFDLDGNAAEWAVGDDGTGVAHGRSADTPAESRGGVTPGPAYVGLRVVVGAPPEE